MKEIRLHGIGGQGTVKAGELLVHASVLDGNSGNSIPFFGFERQGAPVTSFVRLDKANIRPKNQVYNPNCIIVIDPTVMQTQDVFEGIQENSYFVINTPTNNVEELRIPSCIQRVAMLDATKLAVEVLKRPMPNTAMLAAFARLTGWITEDNLRIKVTEMFGEKNREVFDKALEVVQIVDC